MTERAPAGAVRTYGPELAVVTVTERRARISVAGAIDEFDVGEEIGARAVVNRVVAALPGEVGLVAVATPQVTWVAGALDILVGAAARNPRAGLLGPAVAAAGVTGWLDGTCVLLRRAAWDSVDGYATRIADPHRADVDLGTRLGRAGWLVMAVSDVEVAVRPAGAQGMLSG